MIKTIKRVLLSSLSILGLSLFLWTAFLLNPQWSYAKETQFDFVTVYHNNPLEEGTEEVVNRAINIIKKSKLYSEEVAIDLCLNDGSFYPNLNPLGGGALAHALLDKTAMNNCTVNFNNNSAETKWAVNNYEYRKFDLAYLIAHEFTHNLQYHADLKYVIKSSLGTINWKLEGHADYVARQYSNDGQLKERISFFLEEEKKEHNGLPVFELEDGTKQIFSYFKYSLVVQYLMDEKGMNFKEICAEEKRLDKLYSEMIAWSKK